MSDLRPADWRLLRHGASDAAWNMAVDEAMLERYEAPEPPAPTLRLYGWRPAALSLGRSQDAQASHDPRFLRDDGIDLVRRPTGGGAVLHDAERTYAVVGPLSGPFGGAVLDTYERIAGALSAALSALGIEARVRARAAASPGPGATSCFAETSAHEIAVDGRKLVGSAQLRRRTAFLQHGSILLRADPARLARALGAPSGEARFTDLASALGGRAPDTEMLDAALARGFALRFGVRLVPGALTDDESRRAEQLRCWKYLSRAWTLEGRAGERERRWGPAAAMEDATVRPGPASST